MDYKEVIRNTISDSIDAKKTFLSTDECSESFARACEMMVNSLQEGGKLLVFGNGGSAADSQHMAAELVVRFEKERKGIPCIALTTDTSILTAGGNDYGYNSIFARQIEALGTPGDVALAISTSGNSENILKAVNTAKEKKMFTVALSGRDGGALRDVADVNIIVPSDVTARIQEVHSAIIHTFCKIIEDTFSK